MIGERWGGSALIRAAVEREIAFLIDDFAHELTRIESMQHIHDSEDLKVLANIWWCFKKYAGVKQIRY